MTEIEILRRLAKLVEDKMVSHMTSYVNADWSQGLVFDLKGVDGEILDLLIEWRKVEGK